MSERSISVNLSVMPENEEQAMKVIEALSRVGAGLAFEGIGVSISIHTYGPEED